ncbi:hypothetical protein EST38_g8147 [Candolleomyces aberdarensis]|uniref:Peptidase C14 caspase domain-containing protein n=1 Tax=Candolleomyces aberdarensis TaxID=2316362 RepID=A0A4Q2DDB5_9AGAR|nr:hypothetical protein EST38_g8147 [Candolleomyces aberdarensis]
MISSSPVQLGGEVECQRYPEDLNDNRNAETVTKTVYRQDDSQGPIYNGDISGGVTAVYGRSVSVVFSEEYPLRTGGPNSEDDIGDGGNNEDAQPHNRPEKSQHDSGYNVSSMSELELRSIQSQVTTNAEIYTRSMLCCNEGLPCWRPQPRKPIGLRGIVPGDVGTFDLTHGFRKIFNLWEDESAGGWDLPAKEIVCIDHFAEGHTIASGASSKIRRSEDGKYIQVFEFQCNTEKGAVLACTTSADVEELNDTIALRDFLIQHAGVVYQRATSLRRLAEEESLYIISGSIKSDGWGLAAYQGATSGEGLILSKRHVGDGDPKGVQMYEWTDRGTAEARFGLNSTIEAGQYEGKNQSLFLRGFKLAFSPTFRARMRGLKQAGSNLGSFDGGQGKYKPNNTGHGPSSPGHQPGSTGTRSNASSNFSSVTGSTTLSNDVKVDSFPDISGVTTFHPCDLITDLLLEMNQSRARMWFTTYLDALRDIVGNPQPSRRKSLSKWLPWTKGKQAPVTIEDKNPSPLWSLIIGINDYQHSDMRRLKGATRDADAVNNYLQTDLRVPGEQIINLRNGSATRGEIIAAFNGLRNNPRIKPNDPILIYFAGHGGESGNSSAPKTQSLIPVDFSPKKVYPIPDRTVAALINGIAQKHGNNITVILDCCHSGSGTHGGSNDESTVRGCQLDDDAIPDHLDRDILEDSPADTRGLSIAKGFAVKDMHSHILLAACSANELAREDAVKRGQDSDARGRFTFALLDLLRSVSPNQITYGDVLTRIPSINGQNPQCEGYHKNRILFDKRVRATKFFAFEVNLVDKGYILEAGRAHGITDNSEFTLFRNRDVVFKPGEAPLAVMKVKKIGAFTTVLRSVEGRPTVLENGAIAVQTKAGDLDDLLIYGPIDKRVIKATEREMSGTGSDLYTFKQVDTVDKAMLEILAVGEDKYVFKVRDNKGAEREFTRIPHVVEAKVDDDVVDALRHVLRAAAHYHLHLNFKHPNNNIQDKIGIEFFMLKTEEEGDPNDDGQDEAYEEENAAGREWTPIGDNMHQAGRIEIVVDNGAKYGMKITNNTPHDLHWSGFWFDHTNFEITALSDINGQTRHNKDHSLSRDSAVQTTVFELCVKEDVEQTTIGFFKFYFTSEVVDLSHIPQLSPFSDVRGFTFSRERGKPVWGIVLIPVIRKRLL